MTFQKVVDDSFRDKRKAILQEIVQQQSNEIEGLKQQTVSQKEYLEETTEYLNYLKQALLFDSPPLFLDSLSSIKNHSEKIQNSSLYYIQLLKSLREVLSHHFSSELLEKSRFLISVAIEQLKNLPFSNVSYLQATQKHYQLAKKYLEHLLTGEQNKASELIQMTIAAQIPIKEIYLNIFQPTQYEIGRLWQNNSISIAEEHYCTASTQLIMTQLYPYIFKGEKKDLCIIASSIGENLHEMGIRMVSDFLEIERYNTYYLGANTPDETLIKILIEKKSPLLALSVTLPVQLEQAFSLIQKIRENEQSKKTKIMMGGFAFNLDQSLWKKIGADGYAANAEEAVQVVRQLLN